MNFAIIPALIVHLPGPTIGGRIIHWCRGGIGNRPQVDSLFSLIHGCQVRHASNVLRTFRRMMLIRAAKAGELAWEGAKQGKESCPLCAEGRGGLDAAASGVFVLSNKKAAQGGFS